LYTPARVCFLLAAIATFVPGQTLPSHPRLLFNADGISHLKARVLTKDATAWAGEWKDLQSRFDAHLKDPIELPPRGSNWGHWYVCPKHGARLTTGKQIGQWQWEHICPVDHESVKSDPSRPERDFDGCVLAGIHDRYAREILTAGILFQVTRDDRYLQRGRDILVAYADRYLSYPLHTIKGEAKIGGGRLSPQTLDESVWLIPVAQGADLLWDKLADEDRKTIAEKLFLPAARDVILPHHLGIHNIQCWKNSAVGLTGFLLDDSTLIQAAIDDPDRGYRVQMAKGVQSDGVWHEGAWGYHFYTMSAVWPLVEAARNCGINLYGDPFRKMFEAPVQLAMPNLVLPAFNDSTETDVHNPLYELGYARYRDPVDLVALAGQSRQNNFGLWFGVDTLPSEQPLALGSRNATASGYAILQRGSGIQATWLCLKYGPHGGGHGHPDKNNFVLYSKGRVLFPDPGTRPYGSPLHGEWDRVTLAHNTLVVDETSQRPATGKSLAFGSDHGVDYAMTDAGNIYDGVRFVRTAVLLNENLVLFVDQVQADKSHTFDLAVHYAGRWTKAAGTEKVQLPAKDGYQHLQDISALTTGDGATLLLDGAAIVLAGNEKTQVITATGIGRSTEDRVPVAIFRRNALQTTYVWAAALDGKTVKLKMTTDAPGVVGVQVDKWKVSVDREHATVKVN
jgi:hypothetical protein